MRAEFAWLALVGVIAAYELACPSDQLLTAGADRIRASSPLGAALVYASAFSTALHLVGYRGRIDPFQMLSPLRAAIRKELAPL